MKITVIDEHHEVFLLWEEAVAKGRIKKGATLLHVDAHSDLSVPFLTESVYTKDTLGFFKRQLNIANFIIPEIARGVFKEVIFLNRELDIENNNTLRKTNYIGTLYGKGKWINNGFSLNKITRKLYPDFKQWHFTTTNDIAIVKTKEGVLDIDLDYFYGHFHPQSQISLKLTKAQVKRLKQVSISQDRYKLPLDFFSLKKGILRADSNSFFTTFIYNDSQAWIECAIRYFVDSLKMKPTLVSVCRSAKSGYMPKKYAEFTEHTLIDYLSGKEKKIDPCDIVADLEIYPFIACIDNVIYNPLTNNSIKLKQDSYFIWKRLRRGANFNQIFQAMRKSYDVSPQIIKKEILKFIFKLKRGLFIK